MDAGADGVARERQELQEPDLEGVGERLVRRGPGGVMGQELAEGPGGVWNWRRYGLPPPA